MNRWCLTTQVRVVAMFVVVDLEIMHIMNSLLVTCLCSQFHVPGPCYFSFVNTNQKLQTTVVRTSCYFTLLLTTVVYTQQVAIRACTHRLNL